MDPIKIQSSLNKIESYFSIVGDKLSPQNQEIASDAFGIYRSIVIPGEISDPDKTLETLEQFHEDTRKNERLRQIAEFYRGLLSQPKAEAPSIPDELEALVDEYKKHQEDVISENDGSGNSVAEAVKRATETMKVRQKVLAIRRARASSSSDPSQFEADEIEYFEKQVALRSNTKENVLKKARENTAVAVNAYIENYAVSNNLSSEQKETLTKSIDTITQDVVFLGHSGAIDLSNRFDLITAIEVSLYGLDPNLPTATSKYSNTLQEVDEVSKKTQEKIYQVENEIASERHRLSQTTDFEEKKAIQIRINRLESHLQEGLEILKELPDERQRLLEKSQNEVEKTLSKQSKQIFDDKLLASQQEYLDRQRSIQGKLNNSHEKFAASGVEGKSFNNPPSLPGQELADAITVDLPELGIRLHANKDAAQIATLLSHPKTRSEELSPEAVLLVGKGVTLENFDQVIAYARNNPRSELGKIYAKSPEAFGHLRQQIKNIHQTLEVDPFSKTFDPNSALNKLFGNERVSKELNSLGQTLAKNKQKLNSKSLLSFIKNNPESELAKLYKTDSQLIRKAGKELDKVLQSTLVAKIFKPLGKIEKRLNVLANKYLSAVFRINNSIFNFAKLVMDPWGFLKEYSGRKVGQFLLTRFVPNISNAVLRQSSTLFLKDGAKEALRYLSKQAAEKIALKIATQKGASKVAAKAIQAALQLLNVIPGGFIVSALAYLAVELIFAGVSWAKKQLDKVWQTMGFGENFRLRDVMLPVAVTAATIFALIKTVPVAAKSAGYIIAGAAIATAVFFIIPNIIGPVVSGLAQLSATSYRTGSNYYGEILPGCPTAWPVKGVFPITETMNIGSHSYVGYNEAIDIGLVVGNPIYSTSYGTVSYARLSSEYLFTNVVVVETQLPPPTNRAFSIVYGHLSRVDVREGDKVEPGTQVGLSGTAGTGPHLHYEYKNLKINECPPGGVQFQDMCPGNCGFTK